MCYEIVIVNDEKLVSLCNIYVIPIKFYDFFYTIKLILRNLEGEKGLVRHDGASSYLLGRLLQVDGAEQRDRPIVGRSTLLHFDQKSDGYIVGFSTLPYRMYDTMNFFKRRWIFVGYPTSFKTVA